MLAGIGRASTAEPLFQIVHTVPLILMTRSSLASPEYTQATRKVFVLTGIMTQLIYRGKRIVNWCPHCETSISDDEAEQLTKVIFGTLRYLLGWSLLMALNTYCSNWSRDLRWRYRRTALKIQKRLILLERLLFWPIVNREIPLLTGMLMQYLVRFVKVTPAHDPNDFAMGQTHNLGADQHLDEHVVVVDGR